MADERRDPRKGVKRLTAQERREEDERRRDLAEEGPLGEPEEEDTPDAARPAAGEAPFEHLVTGRFGDTTPDPLEPEEEDDGE